MFFTILKGQSLIRKCNFTSFHAFTDVDWAGNLNDQSSTLVYVVFYGFSPVSQCSKKQQIIARSSTEIKYRVMSSTTAELSWIRNLLFELQISLLVPSILCDNMGATYSFVSSTFHSQMKHITIYFYFVPDQVAKFK